MAAAGERVTAAARLRRGMPRLAEQQFFPNSPQYIRRRQLEGPSVELI